jgi:hypothetical protein
MMKRMWSIAIVIVAVSAAVDARTGQETDKSAMGDKPTMMYTGCIESVNHGGSYVLTHLADDHQMGMAHDGGMVKDSSMPMKKESAASNEMQGAHMMPGSLVLTGPSDLKKHVGQKVTVTGSVSKGSMDGGTKSERETLTVGSLKVVAKACK